MDVPDLTGPFGGIIASAFIAGCASGYAFARETIVKLANERIGELSDKVEHLEEEYKTKVESLNENYDIKAKNLRDQITLQAKRYDDLLTEQEKRCDERMKEAIRAHEKRTKALEDRIIELEESRLQIALNQHEAE